MGKNTKEIEELKARLKELEEENDNVVELVTDDYEAEAIEVEAEVSDVEETEEDQGIPMRTVIYLGQREDGGLLFSIDGDKNLLIIDGLLDYAKREMDNIWKMQAELAKEAAKNAQEDAKE